MGPLVSTATLLLWLLSTLAFSAGAPELAAPVEAFAGRTSPSKSRSATLAGTSPTLDAAPVLVRETLLRDERAALSTGAASLGGATRRDGSASTGTGSGAGGALAEANVSSSRADWSPRCEGAACGDVRDTGPAALGAAAPEPDGRAEGTGRADGTGALFSDRADVGWNEAGWKAVDGNPPEEPEGGPNEVGDPPPLATEDGRADGTAASVSVARARRFTTVGRIRSSTISGVFWRSRCRFTRSTTSTSTALM